MSIHRWCDIKDVESVSLRSCTCSKNKSTPKVLHFINVNFSISFGGFFCRRNCIFYVELLS